MTRLEALEAVAAAAREASAARQRCQRVGLRHDGAPWNDAFAKWQHADNILDEALAALDQTAPQPPDVDPQPRRGARYGVYQTADFVDVLNRDKGEAVVRFSRAVGNAWARAQANDLADRLNQRDAEDGAA